jgi:hypothetical protein
VEQFLPGKGRGLTPVRRKRCSGKGVGG